MIAGITAIVSNAKIPESISASRERRLDNSGKRAGNGDIVSFRRNVEAICPLHTRPYELQARNGNQAVRIAALIPGSGFATTSGAFSIQMLTSPSAYRTSPEIMAVAQGDLSPRKPTLPRSQVYHVTWPRRRNRGIRSPTPHRPGRCYRHSYHRPIRRAIRLQLPRSYPRNTYARTGPLVYLIGRRNADNFREPPNRQKPTLNKRGMFRCEHVVDLGSYV